MKRIERVYQALLDEWRQTSCKEIEQKHGSTTQEIATKLKLSRANTSTELNRLVRQAKVIKIKDFPIRYLPVEVVRKEFNLKNLNYYEINSFADLPLTHNLAGTQKAKIIDTKLQNPLENMIGYRGILRQAVIQAKAALMYPPHGLHMMLLGPTGVGKTYFANCIYQYAKYQQIFNQDAPFISFNCADYYNNPQLLLSLLFGYAKGAYTGAVKDQSGLVEQADGGILFLDEVHRLPPEGQEMLFYFIDNGIFSRMGESQKTRHSSVLIICATTEDTNSALLQTFLRRIPMNIQIPSFDDWSYQEKVELVKFLFQRETKRINKNLLVDRGVFEIILSLPNYGNIGQIKSEVQLTCAQAFLNNISGKQKITIRLTDLPEQLRERWVKTAAVDRYRIDLSDYLTNVTKFYVNKPLIPSENEENIYSLIENKVSRLQDREVPNSEIQQYIMTDLFLHIKNFVKQNSLSENIQEFVSPEIIELTQRLKNIAEKELGIKFGQRFIHYFSLHIASYFSRKDKKAILLPEEQKQIKTAYRKEYDVARIFQQEITKYTNQDLPEIEVIYLTMLLNSVESMSFSKKVGIVVAAHGDSTASSMVKVAQGLLGTANVAAVDMPLEVAPDAMINDLQKAVMNVNQGKGVLLLYDMGSFSVLANKISEKTKIIIQTLPNVTTSLILEAIRKVNYLEINLNTLCIQLKHNLIDSMKINDQQERWVTKPKVIVSICMSGEGTAEKIKNLIDKIIYQSTLEPIHVLTVSSLKLNEVFPKILKEYDVIAAVGTKQPSTTVPFISLEDLIINHGETKLVNLINQKDSGKMQRIPDKSIIVDDACQQILDEQLVYFNPRVINTTLQNWLSHLLIKLKITMTNGQKIKCITHTALALERCLKKTELKFKATPSTKVKKNLPIVTKTLQQAVKFLNIVLSTDELLYITEIILDC